jgi:hypothetical protein
MKRSHVHINALSSHYLEVTQPIQMALNSNHQVAQLFSLRIRALCEKLTKGSVVSFVLKFTKISVLKHCPQKISPAAQNSEMRTLVHPISN